MANDLDLLTADIQSYIVAPMAAFGMGGFVFDIEGESIAQLSAEITDHYTEDNKAVQDHIARKPKTITLKGYQGEVTYTPEGNSISSVLSNVAQKLTEVAAFLPQISTATAQLQTAYESGAGLSGLANLSLSSASDIYGLVQNAIGAIASDTPRQQQAYIYFKSLWETGTLMGIQTPWEFMPNMVIESLTAIQTEGSRFISDFSVKYKQMRFAQTQTTAYINNGNAQTGTSVDNLSPQANAAALQTYRAANGMDTPPIDTILQGTAAVQAPDPVSIGNVPGAVLPSPSLPGAQSQLGASAKDIINNASVFSMFSPIPASQLQPPLKK